MSILNEIGLLFSGIGESLETAGTTAATKTYKFFNDDKKPIDIDIDFLNKIQAISSGNYDHYSGRIKTPGEKDLESLLRILWRILDGKSRYKNELGKVTYAQWFDAYAHLNYCLSDDTKEAMVSCGKIAGVEIKVKESQPLIVENLSIFLSKIKSSSVDDLAYVTAYITNVNNTLSETISKMKNPDNATTTEGYTFDEAVAKTMGEPVGDAGINEGKEATNSKDEAMRRFAELVGINPVPGKPEPVEKDKLINDLIDKFKNVHNNTGKSSNSSGTPVNMSVPEQNQGSTSAVDAETLNKTPLVTPVTN